MIVFLTSDTYPTTGVSSWNPHPDQAAKAFPAKAARAGWIITTVVLSFQFLVSLKAVLYLRVLSSQNPVETITAPYSTYSIFNVLPGRSRRDRTSDRTIISRVLYQLSYASIVALTHQGHKPCVRKTSSAADRFLDLSSITNTANGGAMGTRTPNPLLAKQALSHWATAPILMTRYRKTWSLNYTYHWAFALPPSSSLLLRHRGNRSELRGATPNFLPQRYSNRLSRPNAWLVLVRDWLLADFTSRSEVSFFQNNTYPVFFYWKDSFNLSYGYFNQRLSLYLDFSSFKTERIVGFTSVILATTPIPHRLILHRSVYCCARKFCALQSGDSWRHMFSLAVSASTRYITVSHRPFLRGILPRTNRNYHTPRSADTLYSPS